MNYTTAIILNAILTFLVLAALTRIVWFGVRPTREEPSLSTEARDERAAERLAA